MKISDFIFEYPTHSRYNGLCRVRIFTNEKQDIFVLLTEPGDLNPSSSVTNSIEKICNTLIRKGLVPESAIFIEHYESNVISRHSFSLVVFNNGKTHWDEISLKSIKELLSCEDQEFLELTTENIRLLKELESLRHSIDPFIEFPYLEEPEVINRRIEIDKNKIPKNKLLNLIEGNANEQKLQEVIKSDLSLIGEFYSSPQDEYICFSEFPIGNKTVDFVLFTGRSRMDVILIEVKGADHYLLSKNSYENFSNKVEEAASQLRSHWNYIYSNYEYFRRFVHELRKSVEAGNSKYNSFLGPYPNLEVDSDKDIMIRNVIICGRTKDDLKESKKRREYEETSKMQIELETWDTWLNKLRR